jgi:ETC complex I subunit conserved region
MDVRIFMPPKSAMQSGRAQTCAWLLEYELPTARRPEPLMGWTSSHDTLNSVRLRFDSKEAAIAFADKNGWRVSLEEPQERRVRPRSYADNFRGPPQSR